MGWIPPSQGASNPITESRNHQPIQPETNNYSTTFMPGPKLDVLRCTGGSRSLKHNGLLSYYWIPFVHVLPGLLGLTPKKAYGLTFSYHTYPEKGSVSFLSLRVLGTKVSDCLVFRHCMHFG